MNNTVLVKSALICVVTLSAGAVVSNARAAITPGERAMAEHTPIKVGTPAMKTWHAQFTKLIKEGSYVKCYGINAAYKNECGSPSHACGWNAPQARDPNAWVLVPTGLCQRIAGGTLKPAA